MTGSFLVSPKQTVPLSLQRREQTFVNCARVKQGWSFLRGLLEATFVCTALCCETKSALEVLPTWSSERCEGKSHGDWVMLSLRVGRGCSGSSFSMPLPGGGRRQASTSFSYSFFGLQGVEKGPQRRCHSSFVACFWGLMFEMGFFSSSSLKGKSLVS